MVLTVRTKDSSLPPPHSTPPRPARRGGLRRAGGITSALKARGSYSATFGGCSLPNPTRGDRNHLKACSPEDLLVLTVPPALSPKASPILLPRPASGAWPLRSKLVALETPHLRRESWFGNVPAVGAYVGGAPPQSCRLPSPISLVTKTCVRPPARCEEDALRRHHM